MSTKQLWITSLVLSVAICAGGSLELMIRRQTALNLYLANKAMASTAILMITASFLLSALSTFKMISPKRLKHRRYLGLVGYGYAVVHILTSFIVRDPERADQFKFPFPEFILTHPISITAALLGAGIFTYGLYLSIKPHRFNGTPAKARTWRAKLRYGYIGVLCICLHMTLLKYEGWVAWIKTFDPVLPPLSLLVALLLSCMILFKIVQLRKQKRLFSEDVFNQPSRQ